MFSSCRYSDTKVGEYFLQPEVISQWDFKDYSKFYTYFGFDGHVNFVVNLCVKTDERTTKTEPLKKDLSNLPKKDMPGFEGTLEALDSLNPHLGK